MRGKDDLKRIDSSDFNALMELDIATAQAMQNGKNGLNLQMRQDLPEQLLKVPEWFEGIDVRKPAPKYVEDKLFHILNEVFEIRQRLEKTFTRNELVAYDRILLKHLTQENLLPKLKAEIQKDFSLMNQASHMLEAEKEGSIENLVKQAVKEPNNQNDENRAIKNEDAFFKFLAFSGMLEQQRRKDIKKTLKDPTIYMGMNTWEQFYKNRLFIEAKMEPRPVNEAEYQPGLKRVVPEEELSEGF